MRPFARLGGSQQFGSFSPDGTRLAFASTILPDGESAIYVEAVNLEEAQRIAPGLRAAWSPDGKRLAILRDAPAGQKLIVLHDLQTGAEHDLAQLGDGGLWLCQVSRLSWSLDGSTLYTSAAARDGSPCTVVAIEMANGRVRPLTEPSAIVGDMDPVVSPDGHTVAFTRGRTSTVFDVFTVSTQGGSAHRLTFDATDITGIDWEPGSKALLIASRREGGARRLWEAPLDGKSAHALTDGSSAPTFPVASAMGNLINFTQFHLTAPIWKFADGKLTELLDNQSRNSTPAISPDGKRLLYTSDRGGRSEVWLSNIDGSDARPLLSSRSYDTGAPRWSPDGRQALLECHLAAQTHICIWDAGTKGIHQLTSGETGQVNPSWSHDGHLVYFTDTVSGQEEIYRVPVSGGAAIAVTHRGGTRALESWDGRWLYVARKEPQGGLCILPLRGTEQQTRAAEEVPGLPKLGGEVGSGCDVTRDGVVFVATDRNLRSTLESYDALRRTLRPVLAVEGLAAGSDLSVSVFPNGRDLVFTTTRAHSELSMMSPQH